MFIFATPPNKYYLSVLFLPDCTCIEGRVLLYSLLHPQLLLQSLVLNKYVLSEWTLLILLDEEEVQ